MSDASAQWGHRADQGNPHYGQPIGRYTRASVFAWSEMPDLPVLYIVGKGRSGSTLLDRLLGEVDGFFSTGELSHIWEWGFEQRVLCGCGVAVPECPVWSKVIALVATDPAEALRLKRRVLRWRRAPRMLLGKRREVARADDLRKYARLSGELYTAIGEVTGARVIIDSSKWPFAPGPLGLVPGIQPYVVQLVRDPRAVAHSWRSRKRFSDRQGSIEMPRFGSVPTLVSWLARNLTAEWLRRRVGPNRSMLVRYEDLVRTPEETLKGIVFLVGESPGELEFLRDGTARLGENHTVAGNPDRMQRGEVELRADDRWLNELSSLGWGLTTAMGIGLVRRYSYPVRRPASRR